MCSSRKNRPTTVRLRGLEQAQWCLGGQDRRYRLKVGNIHWEKSILLICLSNYSGHLWKDLGDDLHLSSDSEDEQPATTTPAQEPSTQPSPADLISAGLFGASTPSYNLSGLYPAPSEAMKLWQLYLRNIDPILKIVHGPSTTTLLESLLPDMSSVPKETESLLFAIYHFAITTLTEHEREEMYGHSWHEVQRKYHDALRQSLLNRSFYRTTSLLVLQAYTLLLVSVRFQYNSHTFWILCGIAIRLAQRMGLNSEEERHLSPFDLEIRRPVWWHLLSKCNG